MKYNKLVGAKTALRKLYASKLKYHKNNIPETSRNYKARLKKLETTVEKIKLGSYIPTKSDLRNIPKTSTVTKLLKNYDTDNESFYIWNNAELKDYVDMGDISVIVRLRAEEGILTRIYHVDSNRLNNKVSDSDIHSNISKNLEKSGSGYIGITQSNYSFKITSYSVVGAYRYKG